MYWKKEIKINFMETETRKFEVGDVWLCDSSRGYIETVIQKINNDFIKIDGYWEPIQVWNKRAKIKLRRARLITRLLIKFTS